MFEMFLRHSVHPTSNTSKHFMCVLMFFAYLLMSLQAMQKMHCSKLNLIVRLDNLSPIVLHSTWSTMRGWNVVWQAPSSVP